MSDFATRRQALLARIAAAARAAGRDPDAITLVAAAKTQPVPVLVAACAAGQRVFGENRVQEALARWPDLPERAGVELRLIGPLQTNKVREALAHFDVIETLDRPTLAEAILKERARAATLGVPVCQRFLVQVNSGAEPQKAGILPDDAPAFLARCRDAWDLPVEGLMAIPPADGDPRPHFDALRRLAAAWHLPVLSMGMSADFEPAIAAGATHIRLGTALFGARSG